MTAAVTAGQPYARAVAAYLIVICGAVSACGGGTSVTELGGPGAVRCQVSLAADPRVVPADGGTVAVSVDAARDCTWNAAADASWMTLGQTSGQGAGTFSVVIAPSQQPAARTAAVTVNDQRVELSQEARPCRFTLPSDAAEVGPLGGAVTVAVATVDGCIWTASSEVGWIVAPNTPRNGPGTVDLEVRVNPGSQRAGVVTIAGQPFTVTQHAAGSTAPLAPNCAPLVLPTRFDVPAAATTQMIRIEVVAACAWTATSNAPWLTIASEAAGQGAATVRVAVAQNTGAARTGTVTVARQEITIAQAGAASVPPPACTVTIDPEARSFQSSGGEGRVDVTAASGCEWSATTNANWVTVLTSRGTGSGPARYRVQTHTGSQPRSATFTIGGRTHRITQAGVAPQCSFSLAPASASIAAAGGEGRFAVTTQPGCAWTATAGTGSPGAVTWIAFATASGTGPGEVIYTVQPNPNVQPRAAGITVGGQTHTVSQAGTCSYSVNPQSHAVAAAGGEGRFAVTTQPGCAWTVAGGAAWLVVSVNSGAGPGDAVYTVQPNTAAEPRVTTLTVAGQTHTVTQAGAAAACTYGVNPASQSIPAAGGESRFTLATQSGCAWSAVAGAQWVSIANPAGTGQADVVYTVQANPAPEPRSTTIAVGGQVHTVSQAGAAPVCTYSLQPASQSIAAAGGEGRFTVNTQPGCAWSTSGGAPWLSIANPSGSGPSDVVYTVQANASTEVRSTTIAAGGQIHTVTQSGAAPVCTYALQPASLSVAAAGGEGRFAVSTQPGCAWTASGGATWITIAAGSGTGPGEVVYNVQANGAADQRSAAIVVGGQTHTVTQAGVPPPCTYSLSSGSSSAPAAGGEGRFTVQTQPGCTWNAVPNVNWISVVSGAAGTGGGEVVYNVQANTGTDPRVGAITAGGQSHGVTQAGASPPSSAD